MATTERERRRSLEALASFCTEVILRAPQSLTHLLEHRDRVVSKQELSEALCSE